MHTSTDVKSASASPYELGTGSHAAAWSRTMTRNDSDVQNNHECSYVAHCTNRSAVHSLSTVNMYIMIRMTADSICHKMHCHVYSNVYTAHYRKHKQNTACAVQLSRSSDQLNTLMARMPYVITQCSAVCLLSIAVLWYAMSCCAVPCCAVP